MEKRKTIYRMTILGATLFLTFNLTKSLYLEIESFIDFNVESEYPKTEFIKYIEGFKHN